MGAINLSNEQVTVEEAIPTGEQENQLLLDLSSGVVEFDVERFAEGRIHGLNRLWLEPQHYRADEVI